MDDPTLIEALKAAGHEDQARQLQDRHLAHQLRDAGHDSLADALEGDAAPAEVQPAKPKTARVEAEAIAHALKRDTGRDITPDSEGDQFAKELKEAASGSWNTDPDFFTKG